MAAADIGTAERLSSGRAALPRPDSGRPGGRATASLSTVVHNRTPPPRRWPAYGRRGTRPRATRPQFGGSAVWSSQRQVAAARAANQIWRRQAVGRRSTGCALWSRACWFCDPFRPPAAPREGRARVGGAEARGRGRSSLGQRSVVTALSSIERLSSLRNWPETCAGCVLLRFAFSSVSGT